MGIGDKAVDYGPKKQGEEGKITGTDGGAYWSDKESSFAEMAAEHNVTVYTRLATTKQASQLSSYWNNLLGKDSTYHFVGQQCTTSATAALRQARMNNFRTYFPDSLNRQLSRTIGWK